MSRNVFPPSPCDRSVSNVSPCAYFIEIRGEGPDGLK